MSNAKFTISNSASKLFLLLLAVPLLILVIFVVVIYSYKYGNKNILTPQGAGSFSDCGELSADCADSGCQYYSLCNFVSDYGNCRVYDCGKNYGVEVTAENGRLLTKTYDKPSIAGVKEKINACAGTVKVVGNKCENNVGKIITEIVTSGNCLVEAIIFKQGGQSHSASFTNLGNSRYSFNASSCKDVSVIKAIGPSGTIMGIFGE